MLRLVVFGALVAIVCGQTTQVQQCTQNDGDLPINVYISGCKAPPCGLPQMQDAVIDIDFKAPRNIERMTTLATAYILVLGIQIPVPYPLEENAETCNFLKESKCPVQEGEELQYSLRLPIEPVFPVMIVERVVAEQTQICSVAVEFRIVDGYNAPLLCIRVPITILPPN